MDDNNKFHFHLEHIFDDHTRKCTTRELESHEGNFQKKLALTKKNKTGDDNKNFKKT